MNKRYIIHTDGGSRGNPGPAAYAYVIEPDGEPAIHVKCYLGRSTNNVAEYMGLLKALEHARELGAEDVVLHSDSELMVRQMNGEYKVRNPGLAPLYEQASGLAKGFRALTIRHVRREQNKEADRLCNEAMDHPGEAQPRPTAALFSPPPARKDPAAELRQRAIAYLEKCAAEWADADPASPQVAEVWDKLWDMIKKAGLRS